MDYCLIAIYLIGIIVSIATFLYVTRIKYDVTLSDLLFIIACSVFSWLAVILCFIVFYGDMVILKKRK